MLSFTQSPANNTFNAVFSTLRLLSNAISEIWSADTTYQTNWQGYPCNIAGALDRIGQFHILAFSLSTHEKTDDYAMLFFCCCCNKKCEWYNFLAASQIPNGFKLTFPGVKNNQFWRLMCEFHVMKAINAFAFNSIENKTEIKARLKM